MPRRSTWTLDLSVFPRLAVLLVVLEVGLVAEVELSICAYAERTFTYEFSERHLAIELQPHSPYPSLQLRRNVAADEGLEQPPKSAPPTPDPYRS
jgi:hypothetical protein